MVATEEADYAKSGCKGYRQWLAEFEPIKQLSLHVLKMLMSVSDNFYGRLGISESR